MNAIPRFNHLEFKEPRFRCGHMDVAGNTLYFVRRGREFQCCRICKEVANTEFQRRRKARAEIKSAALLRRAQRKVLNNRLYENWIVRDLVTRYRHRIDYIRQSVNSLRRADYQRRNPYTVIE